jgi:putative FmdB family regulatory protein
MPTYEYICEACQHTFDEFQSFSDEPLKKCPACKKKKLQRAIGTGAAILFKGSGFYQTDYRSEAYKSAAKADAESSKPPADAKIGKSDSGGTSSNGADKKSEAKGPSAKK